MTTKELITSDKPYILKYRDRDETLKGKAKKLLWDFNNSRPNEDKNVVRFYKNYLELVVH